MGKVFWHVEEPFWTPPRNDLLRMRFCRLAWDWRLVSAENALYPFRASEYDQMRYPLTTYLTRIQWMAQLRDWASSEHEELRKGLSE